MMSVTLGSQEKSAEVLERGQEAVKQPLPDSFERQVTMTLTPEFYFALEQLTFDTRQDLGRVFAQAIALYKAVVDLKRQGKHVGVVDDENKLDEEFVGLGSADSGL